MDPQPIVLEGRDVRLEPLDHAHAGDLFAAGAEPAIWRHLPRGPLQSQEDVHGWIEAARRATEAGDELAFAIVELAGQRAIGSTRYLDIRRAHRGLEIGWTWIATAHQRTRVNTECKRLLLGHAFDGLGAQRVQLKTDARNLKSQRAIERIGAVREGVLRRHMFAGDGVLRDTVMYSVVADEWPAVRARLDLALVERG
jgi:RimJ/RimL family protein N-acetyltransferase